MTVHRSTCDCGEWVTLDADEWMAPCWVTRHGEITECCPMCGHDLRHRWISLALRRGVPLAEVAAAAGHARQSVTADTYSHVVLEPGDLEPVAWEER